VISTYGFHFSQPWWLLAGLLVVPVVWLGRRSLGQLGTVRRILAITLRVLVVLVLVALLAGPTITEAYKRITLIAVIDRSRSVPRPLQEAALGYLSQAVTHKRPGDQLAVVDVAEAGSIARLPSTDTRIPQRSTSLTGEQTDLAGGVQLGMAIAPPDSAIRMLLVSDGNETAGDLREAARVAAANRIPMDVLPLRYSYPREVVFKRLVAPARARSGQTVALRFVLASTAATRGRLLLTLNGEPVDLDPTSPAVTVPVQLKRGTNVKTVSIPLGTSGMHEFRATFLPGGAEQDTLTQNNRADGMTLVAGAGHVLVLAQEDAPAAPLVEALRKANLDVRLRPASELPTQLAKLLDTDAVVLVNTDTYSFSYQQQEMLCRYVTELGRGLVMVGGPESFGAGGWIGSPVAKILPVDLDPPQKKQMPKGALVLIMHACEMPRGNFWGKQVAIAAVKALSRLDLAGVVDYGWDSGDTNWVFRLGPVGDKQKIIAAIKRMQMGDMPDFGAPMRAAYLKLKKCDAVQKHIIIISDGDPSPPNKTLLNSMKKAGITCTGVAVFPHSPADVSSLLRIARVTGGRFYNPKDPKKLPRIFVKEAQVVRRALVVEEPFVPQVTDSLSEIVSGLGSALPKLDGYVLTGPKGGLTRIVLASPRDDPILATGQSGLGRCVAFTSAADSRWAPKWLGWGGFSRFWEQTVRWAGKPSRDADCEVFADVQGRQVAVTVEAVDAAGEFVQFASVAGRVIAPDMSIKELVLTQVGPGRYSAGFRANQSGSYLVNMRYQRVGGGGEPGMVQTVVNVPYAPEFRDLSDNVALLSEVAASTGGRVLPVDPHRANLFRREGMQFPQTALPLTKPLMICWLALFLLDVAVRRIALDVRVMARRVAAALWAPFARGGARVQMLERLKSRHRKVRDRLARQPKAPTASRRYEAPEGGPGELPAADLEAPKEPPAAEKPPKPPQPEPRAGPQEAQTPLGRLLQAKRKARDRLDGRKTDDDK